MEVSCAACHILPKLTATHTVKNHCPEDQLQFSQTPKTKQRPSTSKIPWRSKVSFDCYVGMEAARQCSCSSRPSILCF